MPKPLTLYYDEACPRCSRWATALQYIGKGALRVLPLRSQGLLHPMIDPEKALRSMPAATPRGNVVYGFDSFVAILKHVWWLRLFWPLGLLLQLTGLGEKCYLYLSTHRRMIRCDQGDCSSRHQKSV